jgi:hypothetical protein
MSRETIFATEDQEVLLATAGDNDPSIALPATHELAKALELPLRKSLMSGDIVTDIFERIDFKPGQAIEFPLDFLAPGTQKDYVAYTIPNAGRIPEKHIEGDYVSVPTYDIGASIDWLLKYSRDARWDIANRAMAVLEAQFTKKMNDDGWHTLLAAGVDRNIVVFDSDAGSGQFTKRVISLAKTIMTRNGGGNSASNNKAKLTDLYMSPEGIEGIRNWGVDIVDEFTRREIFVSEDNKFLRIFSVNLHDIFELGEGQEYQNFFTNQLGGAVATGDLELAVGLDLEHTDSFVMPVRQDVEIFEDALMHRQRRTGLYGWGEFGWLAADNRRVLLLSY